MTPVEVARKLEELAARCEAAHGADREIDLAILEAVDPSAVIRMDLRFAELRIECQANGLWPHRKDACRLASYVPPRYTASIDAAMALVGDKHWRVEDHPMAGPCAIVDEQDGYAATPALALVAAALRARASDPGV